jgi:hypothetical protein
VLINGYYGGLIQNDPTASQIDEGIGGAKIHRDVVRPEIFKKT